MLFSSHGIDFCVLIFDYLPVTKQTFCFTYVQTLMKEKTTIQRTKWDGGWHLKVKQWKGNQQGTQPRSQRDIFN